MIDLHNHVLPGLDDGAHHLAMSLRMLEQAASQGITRVACTPHLNERMQHVSEDVVQRVYRELCEAVTKTGLPVELCLASEIMLSPVLLEQLDARPSATYRGERQYFLIEFPVETPFEIILNAVKAVVRRRFTPLLAHFERFHRALRKPDQPEELRAAGAVLTLDAGSLTGQFGPVVEKRARQLLNWHCIDLLASDAHDDQRHGFYLRDGREAVAAILGSEVAEKLVLHNPQLVWEGKPWIKPQHDVKTNADRPS